MNTSLFFAFFLSLPAWLISCMNADKVLTSDPSKQNNNNMTTSFYDLKAISIDGDTIEMSAYKGKKIVVLNTASKCGYTPQYKDWQTFHEQHGDNFVVLGFPCNQFLGQEPGSASEIETFCQKNYGVTFQMFDKVDVKGKDQHPVYQWLTDPAQNGWNKEVPSWNFCKYLIDENGKLTHFFASKIKPDSKEFVEAAGLSK